MPRKIDWAGAERKLLKAATSAIIRFSKEHAETTLRCLVFDSDPRYGHVLISLDSAENNLRAAKRLERFAMKSRRKNLTGKLTWQWARYQLGTPALSPFNMNSGDFAWQEYDQVDFPEWRELAKRGDYPRADDCEDDYLESNVRIVLWRAAERLIKSKTLKKIRLASPFLLGYGIHDQEEAILRILNWPTECG